MQKFTIKVEKTFSRNEIIWYAFYCKIATLNNFEKNSAFFQKETKKVSAGLSKLHSTCQEALFEEKYFFIKIISKLFSELSLSKKLFAFFLEFHSFSCSPNLETLDSQVPWTIWKICRDVAIVVHTILPPKPQFSGASNNFQTSKLLKFQRCIHQLRHLKHLK